MSITNNLSNQVAHMLLQMYNIAGQRCTSRPSIYLLLFCICKFHPVIVWPPQVTARWCPLYPRAYLLVISNAGHCADEAWTSSSLHLQIPLLSTVFGHRRHNIACSVKMTLFQWPILILNSSRRSDAIIQNGDHGWRNLRVNTHLSTGYGHHHRQPIGGTLVITLGPWHFLDTPQ